MGRGPKSSDGSMLLQRHACVRPVCKEICCPSLFVLLLYLRNRKKTCVGSRGRDKLPPKVRICLSSLSRATTSSGSTHPLMLEVRAEQPARARHSAVYSPTL